MFEDEDTGEQRYHGERRPVDGIKYRYSPK